MPILFVQRYYSSKVLIQHSGPLESLTKVQMDLGAQATQCQHEIHFNSSVLSLPAKPGIWTQRIEDDRSPPIDLLYQKNATRMTITKESCLPPVPTSPSRDMCGHPYRWIFIAEIHSHAIYPAGGSDFKSSSQMERKIAMVRIEDKERCK